MEAQGKSRYPQELQMTALTEISDEALSTVHGGLSPIDIYDAVRDFIDGFVEGYENTQK